MNNTNKEVVRATNDLDTKNKAFVELQYKVDYLEDINKKLQDKVESLEKEAHKLRLEANKYLLISDSFWWKLTKPCRAITNVLKKIRVVSLAIKAIKMTNKNGISYTIDRVKEKLSRKKKTKDFKLKELYTAEELEQQKNVVFDKTIKFSIVVPLYNTPMNFLKEMIESVQNQTYQNWELCMADGSDEAHANVGKYCEALAENDARIKYQKLVENFGISGNTNACLEMATGDYIGLFDHDDLLHPAVLFENMKAICDQEADFIYTDECTFRNTPEDAYSPHFKQDYAPDTLRSYNYICHFTVFSRALYHEVGGFRSEYDGSQDYDLILRLTEKAKHIVHIPKILYYWRASANSTAADISAKPYTIVAAKKALKAHLDRVGLKGVVTDATVPSTYRIKYEIEGEPLVSILIPTCDHWKTLDRCLKSIFALSTYKNYEIVLIENNSKEEETFAYYNTLKENDRIRYVEWKGHFNYSAINNFGARHANGDYYLLLNNDVEIISPDWIQEMLMYAQRRDVGVVGAMLYYPSDKIQHAGVILGIGGVAGHAHKYYKRGSYGYMSRLTIAQNYSAVTAACLLVSKQVYDEVGGLNEKFEVAFNDVDFCMKVRKAGYLNVWTPYAELYHYESESRGLEDTPEKQMRFKSEIDRFHSIWFKELEEGDPFYNVNLSITHEDFSYRC